MGVKIVKVCPASFVGDDCKEIEGIYIYVVPSGNQANAQPERIFLSDDKLAGMAYEPKYGDTVYLFRNAYGRVIDILKA